MNLYLCTCAECRLKHNWRTMSLSNHRSADELEILIQERNAELEKTHDALKSEIEERKKVEKKIQSLANIMELSGDAIITTSFDDMITSWNKGAEHFFSYSAEEILGKPMSILEPPGLAGETEELAELIKQGDKIIHIYISSSTTPLTDCFCSYYI